MKARQDKYQTIAFTLPISCQICLGKVKQPVLCPNNHVFCSGCMDVWLQRNKQCPACRTPITPGNPVKKIAGGLSHGPDERDKMSNPELRKARFDLLFKEYEEEFERLSGEVQLLRTENEVLQQQVQKNNGTKQLGPKEESRYSDSSGVLVLNKKLQDAQKIYEKVKSELSRVKQENNSLKDENINLNRENQKLRQEIGNRSPHRYGRYTVATLEAKIQTYEKEVGQLNKALEKSDKLIEELNEELDTYRSKPKSDYSSQSRHSTLSGTSSLEDLNLRTSSLSSKRSLEEPLSSQHGLDADLPSKRQLFSDDREYKSSHRDYLNGGSTLDDPNKGRYNSSSYMTSSQTSVTSSITFSSSSHLSTAPSSSSTSMLPPTSTYTSYQVSKSLDPIRESSAKGNSYLSNTSTTGDISRSDSFLPEPKKRLFDSNDDLDMSLSPIKTTRKTDKY